MIKNKNNSLSVILPVLIHNQYLKKLTIRCIENLRYFTYPYELEIIMIHNQAQMSSDIKSCLTENDIYLPQLDTNLKLGKCINIGINNANSNYICILANDVMLHHDWFKYAKSAIDNDKLDIVIPWVLRFGLETYLDLIHTEKYIHPCPFTDGGGNCSVFKKSTYDRIGPFDENLVMCSDRDYNTRIGQLGIRVGNHVLSNMTHLGSMTWEFTENKDIFCWGDFDDNEYLAEKNKT